MDASNLLVTFSPMESGALNRGRCRQPSGSVFSPRAWARLAKTLRLSPREMQIVQSVFDDQKAQSIAHELGISPHTVSTYFQRLYTKLHVSSRAQLIVRVVAEYLAVSGATGHFAHEGEADDARCPVRGRQTNM